MFVALEGLRGCGKSTIAPLLAKALSAVQVPTFPAEFSQARAFIDWRSRNARARAHLFLAALLVTADQVSALLEAGTSVVIDSFAQRTIATHRTFGAQLGWEPPASLPVSITFHLDCSAAERQRRLRSRAKPATWWDKLADQRASQIEGQYARFKSHRIEALQARPVPLPGAPGEMTYRLAARHRKAPMPATGRVTSSPATFHVVIHRPLHPAVRHKARRSSSVTAHIRARSPRPHECDASAAAAITAGPAETPPAPPAHRTSGAGRPGTSAPG